MEDALTWRDSLTLSAQLYLSTRWLERRERETNTLSKEPLYVLKATIQLATTEFFTKEKTQMLDQGHMHGNFIRPLASKGPGTGSTPSLTAR